MKTWINDPQFQQVGSQTISHFVQAGKGPLFYKILPVLDMALRKTVDPESTCNSIISLADYVGEFAPLFTTDILNIILQNADDESVPLLSNCCCSIVKYKMWFLII